MGDRAAGWLRVSTGSQDETNQQPGIGRWIDGHGYELADVGNDPAMPGWWRLHGRSATKGEQDEAVEQVLAAMRAGLLDVLVVWAADRIERRGPEYLHRLIRRVHEAGGRIEFVQDQILNVGGEFAELLVGILAWVAKQETKRKRERMAEAEERIMANSAAPAKPPWGFTTEGEKYNKRLVPTDLARRVVPRVFAMCADEDQSLSEIAAWLGAETGRPWWDKSVGKMIRNPAYRGTQMDEKRKTVVYRIPGEPLVDAALWTRANDALDRRPKRGPVDKANGAMLGGGVLRCGQCGGPMYRMYAGAGNSRAPWYRCYGTGRNRRGCGVMVPTAPADAAADRIVAAEFTGVVQERQVIAGNAAELAARAEELAYALRELDPDDDGYDARHAELVAERRRVKTEPVIPDRIAFADAADGRTYAAEWAATPVPARPAFLKLHGVKVEATGEVVRMELRGKVTEAPIER